MAVLGVNPYIPLGETKHIPKGSIVGQSPDDAHEFQLFILIDGHASLSMFSEDGEETVLHYIGVNEFFGYVPPSCVTLENGFISEPYLPGFRTCAKSDITVSRLPIESYMDLREDVNFLRLFFKSYNSHYRNSARMRVIRSRKTSLASVASFMLFFSERGDSGHLELDPFFTGSEIARCVGAHQVTVYKIVSSLIASKVIGRSKRSIVVLDESRLLKYARGKEQIKY